MFGGKIEAASYIELARMLKSLTTNKDSLDDFVRLYIHFVFNCILFPQETYPPPFVSLYLKILDKFGFLYGNKRFPHVCSRK